MERRKKNILHAKIIAIIAFIIIEIIIPLYSTILNYFLFIKRDIKISLVVPTNLKDFYKITHNLRFFLKYINANNLIIIGDKNIKETINKFRHNFEISCHFIDEEKFIDIEKVRTLISSKSKKSIKRSGWYVQQFLKMEYSRICKDDYYLIWDSDTIPIKLMKIFDDENKPYFDVKTENHTPYFITMKRIFPELGKIYNYSFISEHMLIKTQIMKNLIQIIESRNYLPGDTWYEKIINCIDLKDLGHSGFSEYETYGTFTNVHYRNYYVIRAWKSIRSRKIEYNYKYLNENLFYNISKKYDAITFEK